MSSDALSISKSTIRRLGVGLAVLLVLVLLGAAAIEVSRSDTYSDPVAAAINQNEFQSVVLSSGDVYFGKLTAPGGEFYYLRRVYRLTAINNKAGTKHTLTKLTHDINSPEDLLVINRRQILFVENLNPSGQAAQIIQQGH